MDLVYVRVEPSIGDKVPIVYQKQCVDSNSPRKTLENVEPRHGENALVS